MNISLDKEKVFDKIQNPFIIKIQVKLNMEGMHLNTLIANIKLSWKKDERLLSKIGNKTRITTLSTFMQHNMISSS